jgi:hypothetical protein
VGDELQPFSNGHAGLQPELLAYAVQPGGEGSTSELKHTTLATSRLRFLFLAAKIWRHAGRVGVSYSDHYPERGIFQRLMDRLRAIAVGEKGFVPMLALALRC